MSNTELEIRESYQEAHSELSKRYYKGQGMSKVEFDHQHGNLWADMESELIAKGFITPPGPSLEDRIKALEDKVQ